MPKIVTVVGNRPQFIKAAIMQKQWAKFGIDQLIDTYMVHTGQHYDEKLSDIFFEELEMPSPDVNLSIGSGPIGDQIGAMLGLISAIYREQKPDGILIYGDTNSTAAAAIAGAHMQIPIFHVEAGERNYRRHMAPEEINRVITDELAWRCLTSTRKASRYLLREGYSPNRISWVGDPMYDLFCWAQPHVDRLSSIRLSDNDLRNGEFILATIHRNENTAERERLISILETLDCADLPVVLPVHPRVRNLLADWEWSPKGSLKIIEPVGYFDILALLRACKLCVTDSGGLAREAFFAEIPSIVPMPNSGWPEIVEAGWAKVIPESGPPLAQAINTFTPAAPAPKGLFGDGYASRKIGEDIIATLEDRSQETDWHPLGSFTSLPQATDRSSFSFAELEKKLEKISKTDLNFSPPLEALSEGGKKSDHGRVAVVYTNVRDAKNIRRIASIHAQCGQVVCFTLNSETELFDVTSPEKFDLINFLHNLGHKVGIEKTENHDDDSIFRMRSAFRAIFENELDFLSEEGKILAINNENNVLSIFFTKIIIDAEENYFDYILDNIDDIKNLNSLFFVRPDVWQDSPTSIFETNQKILDVVSDKLNAKFRLG